MPRLHTTDFVGGYKPYSEWNGRWGEKLEILSRAAKVIHKHSFQTFSCVLNVNDICEMDARYKFTEALGHPYGLVMEIAYDRLERWAKAHGVPVKMVIEQRAGYGELCDLFKERDSAFLFLAQRNSAHFRPQIT